jgi:hypothetical protein
MVEYQIIFELYFAIKLFANIFPNVEISNVRHFTDWIKFIRDSMWDTQKYCMYDKGHRSRFFTFDSVENQINYSDFKKEFYIRNLKNILPGLTQGGIVWKMRILGKYWMYRVNLGHPSWFYWGRTESGQYLVQNEPNIGLNHEYL